MLAPVRHPGIDPAVHTIVGQPLRHARPRANPRSRPTFPSTRCWVTRMLHLLGHGITAPGRAKVTCGTGSSVMTLTAGGCGRHMACRRRSRGPWAGRSSMRLKGTSPSPAMPRRSPRACLVLQDEQALTDLARTVADSGGVVFVPALAGLGAPHWRDQARGVDLWPVTRQRCRLTSRARRLKPSRCRSTMSSAPCRPTSAGTYRACRLTVARRRTAF